jgi:hypothetical protein
MIHYLDILKVNKNDEGLVRCFAKNFKGECETTAQLRVNPKADYRSVLRSVKTGEPVVIEQEEITEEQRLRRERRKYKFSYFSRHYFDML